MAFKILGAIIAIALLLAFLFVLFANLAAQASVDIQKVRSKSGVEAWLVEDYSVPIVTIRFAFGSGSASSWSPTMR